MLNIRRKIILTFLLLALLFLSKSFVYAQSSDECQSMSGQAKVDCYAKKVNDLQGQANTLSSQIAVMDNQVSLTEARIAANEQQISSLTLDIDTTTKKISGLQASLENLSKVLLNRIKTTYEVGTVQPFQVLLSSTDASNFFSRLNYLKIAQEHDRKIIFETAQAKDDYSNQKNILEDKKKQIEVLKKQQEDYSAQLAQQKQGKKVLLSQTKGSEATYQSRLADAQRELQQIQSAAQFLITTEPKNVQRGDVIGLMGSTGNSTGPHLHFGVYNASSLEQYSYYSSYENPANVLESKSIKWDTGCSNDPQGFSATGNGSFAWPIDPSTIYISQGFGSTCWSWMYGGKPHPAFDIVGPLNSAVKAAESGKAYICRNCTGDGGNGVFIFHSNGKMTLYWHLQ